MSGTTTSSMDTLGEVGNAKRDLVIQFNKMVSDVETLRAAVADVIAKFNAHTHKFDPTLATTPQYSAPPDSTASTVGTATAASAANAATTDAASDLTAAQVGDIAGTPITV